MAEIAIVSARKSKLEALAKKGDTKARTVLRLANDQVRFLSTVQVGITLIGILTGAIGGSELTDDLSLFLQVQFSLAYEWAKPLALGLVALGITYFSIVLGELLPKKLGLHNPEGVARALAPVMNLVSRAFAPMAWVLTSSTNLLMGLMRIKANTEPSVTEEEIKELINQGTNKGEFEEVEQDIIGRVFHLADRKVASLMTPAMDIEWLDVNDSFAKNQAEIMKGTYSQFPVCDEDLDKVVGILSTKKFLIAAHAAKGQAMDLQRIAVKPLFVPENMTAFNVLELFKQQKSRLAMVVDEYGSVQGMVTMHDLIEALVGDLEEPATPEEEQIVERPDGSFLVEALLPFEDFLVHFEVEDVEAEDRTGFHTLGGFILHLNEQIPRTGEIFVWRNFSFEVLDMDGNRIDKILVTRKHEADEADN